MEEKVDFFEKGKKFEKNIGELLELNNLHVEKFAEERDKVEGKDEGEGLRNPDYKVDFFIDPKAKWTPFIKANKLVGEEGMDPRKCVCIDVRKINSYHSKPYNTVLIYMIDYTSEFKNFLPTMYMITSRELKRLHNTYPNRVGNFHDDQKGDESERFYVSTDEMEPIAQLDRKCEKVRKSTPFYRTFIKDNHLEEVIKTLNIEKIKEDFK